MVRHLAPALALTAMPACLEPYETDTTATSGTSVGTSSSTTSSGTTSSGTTSTTAVVPTSSTTMCPLSTSTGAVEEDPTECVFICDFPDHPPGWCDVWNDPCPEGEKCALVSLDGDNAWETARCVPVAPVPDALHEPCTVTGNGHDGLDSCDRGMICWPDQFGVEATVCIGLCTGLPHEPQCADPDAVCFQAGPPWGLCFSQCDPLAQNCREGLVCGPDPFSHGVFRCVQDVSADEGQLFDPCDYLNDCEPGLYCAEPTAAIECDPAADGCCLPFCDLDAVTPCPGAGQQCFPWYEDHCEAASFNGDVGACLLP